jgi:hypothetical protein
MFSIGLPIYRIAIEMLWDWGFTWKNIEIEDAQVGFNATGKGIDKDSKTGEYQSTGVRALPRTHC